MKKKAEEDMTKKTEEKKEEVAKKEEPSSGVASFNKGAAIAALGGLFAARLSLLYPLGLVTLAAGAWPFTQRRAFDLPILAGLALALDTLIVCGVGRALLDSARHDPVIETLVLGIVAAGLLAASVTALLRLRALRMVDHD